MALDASQIENPGEITFYHALEKYLSEDSVVYWNREVFGREFDFCVLIPDQGIFVVEVKGWAESTVVGVPHGAAITIQTEGKTVTVNPKNQARTYRFSLLNHVSEKTGSWPPVFDLVCFPFISQQFLESSGMTFVTPREKTLVLEDLGSREAFQSALQKAVDFMRLDHADSFDAGLTKRVRQLFEPEVVDVEPSAMPGGRAIDHDWPTMVPYSILAYIPAVTI